MRAVAAVIGVGVAIALAAPAHSAPSVPGVVNYAVLGKGSVGNIVGTTMRWNMVTPPVRVSPPVRPGGVQRGCHREPFMNSNAYAT